MVLARDGDLVTWACVLRTFLLSIVLAFLPATAVVAGGGMVLEGDVCIIEIDFYSAHFTAFQPETRGNEQFCQQLPDTGPTIFVMDYLHKSMQEVPVSFRVIHDVTGQGSYVKLKHVEQIVDIEKHTVFFQPPTIRADASFKIEYDLAQDGDYIGIVTVGHPSKDTIYTAVFPFTVGGFQFSFMYILILMVVIVAGFLLHRNMRARKPAVSSV
jgi:hypothetical protein